ncbi:hypothetical protein CKO18_06555 [Rhodoferax fermentans]|uniref:SpoVT-AbrB domain-containing protein n=2 Tax=Rhodoferax fermentans TaxID=28066 RepID=A0A1T1ARH1_RHOFE|nr:hypothetical protein [Rhodoferax fermentans]OOV06694.1 hypothetical protein RF819_08110 [Rhodoferax fermentans]
MLLTEWHQRVVTANLTVFIDYSEHPAMSNTRLNRWGHSVGLRLPKSVLEAAGLSARSAVSIRLLDSGDIRIRPVRNITPAESDGTEAVNASSSTEWEPEQW